jgi:hypothetical protein
MQQIFFYQIRKILWVNRQTIPLPQQTEAIPATSPWARLSWIEEP